MDARPDVFTNLKKPTRLLFNRLKLLSWFNNMYISISDETFEPFSFFPKKRSGGAQVVPTQMTARAIHRNKGNLCGFGLFIKQA